MLRRRMRAEASRVSTPRMLGCKIKRGVLSSSVLQHQRGWGEASNLQSVPFVHLHAFVCPRVIKKRGLSPLAPA